MDAFSALKFFIVSIITVTFSGGVAGKIPWPKLKIWPGLPATASNNRVVSLTTAG